MPYLKTIIEDNTTIHGRVFDLAVQLLIAVSIVGFSIETLPGLSPPAKQLLQGIEAVTVGIFTVEYILRIAVADRKLGFIMSFYGIVDLLAILPFYVSTGLDLRSIRALRFLRLFQVFKLARYSNAIQRFHRAFTLVKEEIFLFLMVTAMLLYLTAAGIHYFEHPLQPEAFSSVFHGLWWAAVTLTTVGYGDVYPITTGGKIFAFFVLIIGLGIVAVPSGLMASALSEARKQETSERERDDRSD